MQGAAPAAGGNPNLAAFANLSQGKPPVPSMPAPPGAGAAPPMPPMPPAGAGAQLPMQMPAGGGMPMQQGGARPPMPMPSNVPMPAPAGAQQPQIDPGMLQILQAVAKMGRGGDTLLAHLTPGEIAVPPEVQTPKVLATIDKAMEKKGVDMQQFTAGSPQSSMNPQTSLPEYNFMSAFLPAALGLAGSMIVPGLGLAMSPALAGAIGGGAGTALGGLIGGQDPMQAMLGGLGAGAGGYLLGNLMGPASSAAGAAAGDAASQAPGMAAQAAAANGGPAAMSPFGAQAAASNLPWQAAPAALPWSAGGAPPLPWSAAAQAPVSGPMNLWGMLPQDINPMAAAGSALGGMAGSAMGAPVTPDPVQKPSGFDESFPDISQIPSWQQSLGQTGYKGPMPDFSGYDATNPMSHAWNFFPTAQQAMPPIPRV